MDNVSTAKAETSAAPISEPSPSYGRHVLASALPYLVALAACSLILASLYRPWQRDLHIPFSVDGDAHLHQMLVKNFVENGKYYVNPWLGAPGVQELYDFPLPHWTHVLVWAILRLFTHSFGLVLNLYFFLTVPLSAFAALYAFRRLRISPPLATVGAVLFAILPYHLQRAESHLFLSALYILPLAGLVIIWVATGNPLFRFQLARTASSRPLITRDGAIALVVCVLEGWDHPYYAFFAATLLLVAGLLGSFRNQSRRALATAVLLCTVLTGALVTDLLPNIIYFHHHGRTATARRDPVESEMFGLTLIQLLAPVQNHRFLPFARWRTKYDQTALLVNENGTASLGAIGALGFLFSLASLFRRRCSELLYSLGVLNLWAFLLGTIGGAGAIFAFLISPQIRAYNRISVFIGFFSIAACIWTIDQWLRSRPRRSSLTFKVLVAGVVLLIGISDQIQRHYLLPRAAVERLFNDQGAFIGQIEASVPPGSMIFQLPYMGFPEGGSVNNMQIHDPLIGYLHSTNLRWSYGAMKYRDADPWLVTVSAEPPGEMVKSVRAAGFAGIFVDSYGYSDGATSLKSQLSALVDPQPITDPTGRYSFFRFAGASNK